MRLLDAILDANRRLAPDEKRATLDLDAVAGALPLAALTCIDPRLNALLPGALGIAAEDFIWLRNAGNIITGPLSSTMRSLALACAVKGGKEIAIIGHTDCQVGKTTTMELIDRFQSLGVGRHLLPANVNEFFGMFASERANVIKAVDIVRQSPLIGPKIPVHGLLVEIETGKVEWLVNGYQTVETLGKCQNEVVTAAGHAVDALKALTDIEIGRIKFSDTKIGETVTKAEDWLSGKVHQMESQPPPATPAAEPAATPTSRMPRATFEAWRREKEKAKAAVPPKIPSPPPVRPRLNLYKDRK